MVEIFQKGLGGMNAKKGKKKKAVEVIDVYHNKYLVVKMKTVH